MIRLIDSCIPFIPIRIKDEDPSGIDYKAIQIKRDRIIKKIATGWIQRVGIGILSVVTVISLLSLRPALKYYKFMMIILPPSIYLEYTDLKEKIFFKGKNL